MLLSAACAEDSLVDSTDSILPEGEVEVALNLRTVTPAVVGKPLVNDVSRAEGDEDGDNTTGTAKEESVRDIWVLQFDSEGKELVAPRYYTVTSDVVENLNIRLAEAEGCHLYVVANTGDTEWAKGKDFSTLEKFRKYELPFNSSDIIKSDDNDYIPMIGDVPDLDIHKQSDLRPVDIYLTRMLAKISFKFHKEADAEGLMVSKIYIHNLPKAIRMEHNDEADIYPEGEFETQFFELNKNLDSDVVHTFYMPENRQGTNDNDQPRYKSDVAPPRALYVQLFISSVTNGSSFLYTIYLGSNDYNDYNVRRNHNYNVVLNLKSEGRDERVLAAPANCFVMRQEDDIMFDPYSRTETGGRWKYSDYVDKNDPAKTIKSVGIIWQQADVIGDNSAGDKVYIDKYDRIHVVSGTANGSALIAGYNGENRTGDIVWSWHIWVNNEDPGKLANAVPYFTFEWNSSGIQSASGIRTRKGRSLMTCNVGARSANPATPNETFGCTYQWGRKDPFPSGWNVTSWGGNQVDYSAAIIGTLYDNSYKAIKLSSTGNKDDATELFRTKVTNSQTGTVEYTIKNPTHFISPVSNPQQTNQNPEASDGYVAGTDGDWFWGHADDLWGGSDFNSAMQYVVDAASGAILSDNGAEKKSIFDPCPAGWMVPPGDMWLSFTDTGTNRNEGNDAATYEHMNTSETRKTNLTKRGYNMYMGQKFKEGRQVFFPSQGVRLVTGRFNQIGFCGNYHTTTGGKGGRTNAFHLHTPQFMYPFETGYGYTRRATGCSVRCVRDSEE